MSIIEDMPVESFPFIVGWELTLACNLRCQHCASSAGKRRPTELTTNEALGLCDQFPDLLVQEVDFTGGEPLIRKDWERIVSRVSELGIRTKLVTNGTRVTDRVACRMRKAGLTAVGVSIDGLAATHDRIRGAAGLFAQSIAGLDRLLAAGLPVTAITTVNALNIGELDMLLDLLIKHHVPRWQVQPLFGLGRSRETPELFLDESDFMRLGTFVQRTTPSANEQGLEILTGDSFGYFSEFDSQDAPWRGCGAGIVSCGITSDGKVKGCLALPDIFVEGNLKERDLWDIWFDPNSFTFTRNFTKNQLGGNCQGCLWGEQCQGGCTAMSYASTGSCHNDPYCFHRLSSPLANVDDWCH